MNKPFKTFSLICALLFSHSAQAEDKATLEVCKLFKDKNAKVAFLLDAESKSINAGPINAGSVPVSSKISQDEYVAPTKYLVIASSRLDPDNFPSDGFTTKLIKTRSLCKNSVTYKVVLSLRNIHKGETRPYKYKDQLPRLTFADDYGYEEEANNAYKFDPTVLVELIEPK